MSTSPAKIRIPFSLLGCFAISAGLIVMLAFAAIAFSYLRYRQSGGSPPETRFQQVRISKPDNMSQSDAGSTIQVEVSAAGQSPITSIELWINGTMASLQAIPAAGQTSITTNFWWTPPEDGIFSLVGRAIDDKGQIATSPAVIVFIDPVDHGNQPDPEAGKVQQAIYPIPPAEFTSPQPPAAGDPEAAGEEWQGSPGEWLDNLTEKEVPTAPKLVASADGCDVHLDIFDQSANEEGFAVYRQTTDIQEWVHVTDLASHPGEGWVGFQDQNLSGGVTYYVSSYNSQGESSSNLALVNINPQFCPVPQPQPPLHRLDMRIEKLLFEGDTEKIYCYITTNGKNWSRWPEFGFITSSQSGQGIPPLVNPLLVSSLTDEGVESEMKAVELNMECWSWQRSSLVAIGKIKEIIDMAAPQKIHLVFSGATFDVLPKISLDKISTALNLGAFGQDLSVRVVDQYTIDSLGYVPESDQMPIITAMATDYPDACKDFMKDPADKEVYCSPLPGFQEGPGGSNPQMYLIWTVADGYCMGASEGKECFPLSWWEKFAKYNPTTYNQGAKFWVRNRLNGSDVVDYPVDSDQQAWRIHPDYPDPGLDKCVANYRWLEVFLEVNGYIRSAPSNLVVVPCPQPLGDTVDVEVNFYSLTLDNIDDGGDDVTADAVNGMFGTVPAGTPPGIHLGYENWKECGYYWSDLNTSGGIGCKSFNVGAYAMEDLQLCPMAGPPNYYGCNSDSEFNTNNNKTIVTLRDQDTLQLYVNLAEYDNGSDDDTICDSQVWLGPWPLDTWASLNDSYIWLIMNDNGYASCKVHVILNALKAGQ